MADDAPADLPGVLNLTPLNPAFRDNAHALFRRLRETCPVHRDESAGTFIISRFKDARAVLGDRALWKRPDRAETAAVLTRRMVETYEPDEETGELKPMSILLMDDPDHARVRGPLTQALYARAAKCRPQVEAIVEETLGRIDGRVGFDVLADFAVPIPIDVIATILGVDRERRSEFRDLSEGLIHILNPLRTPAQGAHLERARATLLAYFTGVMNARRAEPQDDLITDMVTLQTAGAPLKDGEISRNLIGLLVAGNLTTSDLIGNGVHLLLTHPEEMAKLRADPSLVNGAVEEMLRFAPPTEFAARIASRDMEVGGCPVRQGQSMVMALRGANRDPEAFEAPDRFDVARKPGPHLAFGGGAHICIGAPLARLEAQVAIGMLVARFPNLRLARPEEAPPARVLPLFNGLERLEVLV